VAQSQLGSRERMYSYTCRLHCPHERLDCKSFVHSQWRQQTCLPQGDLPSARFRAASHLLIVFYHDALAHVLDKVVRPLCHRTPRCRDSSLYGRVQTILQDLILDLLKCGDLRDFRVFAHITHFAFSHISPNSRISRSDSSRFRVQIPRVFAHLTN
jgi:hypothetical protein